MTERFTKSTLATCCALAIASLGMNAFAQSGSTTSDTKSDTKSSGSSSASMSGGKSGSSQMQNAEQQVSNAVNVVKQIETDPQAKSLLQQAKGVFIIPKFARGGLGIGGSGGQGVLMANNGGQWSNPVFYDLGGISIGATVGVEEGSVAMLLMNQKALDNFMQDNKFSMTADAGLTIMNYNAKAAANAGKGDVIVWSDTKGAFADASVGVTDIHFDKDDNAAFYKSGVAARDIIAGKVKSAAATPLTRELSSGR